MTTAGGFHEFLLLDARVNKVLPTGIDVVFANTTGLSEGIYSLGGQRRQQLQRGYNIVVTRDGIAKKVLMK